MSDAWRQIGTVRINRTRIYALDPQSLDDLATDVVVEPGDYPVYRRYDVVQWLMTGHINEGRTQKLGDGLFALGSGGDKPTGLPVQFPSIAFGVEAFNDMLRDPVVRERLTFSLTEPVEVPS